ncbi:MAG: hypothetical protein JWO38_3470 [Gemmataceae bacterium]|nr:hypothetical protein [Gemmataceae bacterium]
MTRLLPTVAAVAVLAGTLLAVADPAPPPAESTKVARFIAQLGDADFARREAAEKELEALGAAALDQLGAACRSSNPEVARRARDVVVRVERRVGNEKALVPTMVELNAESTPLSSVLATLSKQSKYAVHLWGPDADRHGRTRVTLKTEKVPFWEAVRKLCDTANLQIAVVGGFVAPASAFSPENSNPFLRKPPALPGGRTTVAPPVQSPTTVYLEPRGKQKRRPAAVYGAVCVEAFPIPDAAAVPDAATALLQVWVEPSTNWLATNGVRVKRAVDTAGQILSARPDTPVQPPQIVPGNGVVIVKNVQGGVVLVNQNATVSLQTVPEFTPNARQVVVNLKPGPESSPGLTELTGVVFGTVRSGAEPLVNLTGLKPGLPAEGSHPTGTEMKATAIKRDGGEDAVDVELSYDQTVVRGASPADLGGAGVSSRAGEAGREGEMLHGVRVTDAAGSAFLPTLVMCSQRVEPVGRRIVLMLRLALRPAAGTQGPPSQVVFWGTYGKPVEVPFGLKDVPLAGGKK